MKSLFLKLLEERVVVFDGAMGTALEGTDVSVESNGKKTACPEMLSLTRPEAVQEVHRIYLDTGCDVIETNTFGANRVKLEAFDLADRVTEINRASGKLARKMADDRWTAKAPRFAAGSLGPTGMLVSSMDEHLSRISTEELIDVFREQAVPLLETGVDLLTIETCQDILEGKCAVLGVKKAMAETGRQVPLLFHATLDLSGRMLLGTDVWAALTIMENMGIQVFGLNCSTGPAEMVDSLRYLSSGASLPISCLPNAGMP